MKSKTSLKTKSPKKSSRSKSPDKSLLSPDKSPKKRKKKVSGKVPPQELGGTISPNPQFDAERSAQR